ncbi:MAG: PAS domain S-box protein [Chthoniobacteraceae bacterium]
MNANTLPTERRILIIDDNASIHQDFRKILAEPSGHEDFERAEAALFGDPPSAAATMAFSIDSAFQGQEGLARAKAARAEGRPYAAAFVDVRMPPGWDGVETIERLWEADAELQVVICTAYSDYSWNEMVAKLGISDRLFILKKPFDNIEVLQLAEALTARWFLAQHARRQIGDLENLATERAAALQQSEAHFRVVAENVGDLVSVVDSRGARTFHNSSFERVLGIPVEELGRTAPVEHIHPDDQMKVVLATDRVLETGEPEEIIYRMRHGDGTWHLLKTQVSPVRNASGGIERLVMVARDISARPALEF